MATTKIQKTKLENIKEGEHFFHSHKWVKGSLLQFISDIGSQKNLILVEVMKKLGLNTIAHPHPYTIAWLHQGWHLRVSQQCLLPYSINLFTGEVLCGIAPLEVCDVLLGKPYLLKRHVVYEPRPQFLIITLVNNLYSIPEVSTLIFISLITTKKCSKIISQNRKFVFRMIHPQGNKNVLAMTSK